MNKIATAVLVGITGLGIFFYLNPAQPLYVVKSVNTESTQTINKASLKSSVSTQTNSSLITRHAQNSSISEIPTSFENLILPEEVAIFSEWGEERGYGVDGGLTLSYESLSDETLLTVANQNDAKAHLVFANRIIASQPAFNLSPEALAKAEEHLYSASILGYTSTLALISSLYMDSSIKNNDQQEMKLAEAYKFAYVGVKRGDPNSSTSFEVLKLAHPISEQQLAAVIANADAVYEDLSEKRNAMGLPPFDNSVPPEVQSVLKRIKQVGVIIGAKLMENKE